jgi:uncharacterized protein YfaP (DUF2135 family)
MLKELWLEAIDGTIPDWIKMQQRVIDAGGKIACSNSVAFCLTWNDDVDLDIHCALPNGNQCFFSKKNPTDWISLDVDKMAEHKGS